MKYATIIEKSKILKESVEKEQKFSINSKYIYYMCKSILNLRKDISKKEFNKAPKPAGSYISRDVPRKDYLELAEYLVNFVEGPHKRLPNFLKYQGKNIRVRDYGYAFARILVYYNNHNNTLPNYVTVNSKAYTKPTETGNAVYNYATKKYGKKFTSLDDILEYVQKHFTYQYYYDDHKSNKQVTDSEAGNCTDLLQWLFNMVKPLGYECKCIHVKCQGGDGHVRGQFKHPKNTGGKWIDRDIAAVADGGSITSIWCGNGTVIATNPAWFIANLNR